MVRRKLFQQNLELFARFNPAAARSIEDVKSRQVQRCTTVQGESNISIKEKNKITYLYSQQGALAEANNWFNSLKLDQVKVLIVYGIGLGYYYSAAQQWLHQDPDRYLIFIEHDPRVMRRFLEERLAGQILADPQVVIQFFSFPTPYNWGDLHRDFNWLFWTFAFYPVFVSALLSYFGRYFDFFDKLALQIYQNLSFMRFRLRDLTELQHSVFGNFYANLPFLPYSSSGHALFGQFSTMPAVICGAGPSLASDLDLFSNLSNKAVLIGAGSGVNLLTRLGIQPHFGAAVDPTKTQENRMLASFAFETPFFYRNRYFKKAFSYLRGPRLYVTGSGAFEVAHWFEKQLGIASKLEIMPGVSTSNFLLEIAGALGCNPIILIGMDLAYTDSARYVEGVSAHPSGADRERNKLSTIISDTFPVVGIDGGTVYTKWDWIEEAVCDTAFKQNNPEITVINATSRGMPILDIPNMPFKEVVDNYLQVEFDYRGWIHGCIQEEACAQMPTPKKMMSLIEIWQQSLERCIALCIKLAESMQGLKNTQTPLQEGFPFSTGLTAHDEIELQEEPAYTHYLVTMDAVYNVFKMLDYRLLKEYPELFDEQKRREKICDLESGRYDFLRNYADLHLKSLISGLNEFSKKQEKLSQFQEKKSLSESNTNVFFIQKGFLVLSGSNRKFSFNPEYVPEKLKSLEGKPSFCIVGERSGKREGQALYFYPEGKIKVETFYSKGRLHGPWTFYSRSGRILAQSLFIEGRQEGKCVYFYQNGALYYLGNYLNGTQEGVQEYYYPDGSLKTSLEYSQGKLNGSVHLYHANGVPAREIHFNRGELHGVEKMWDEAGKLILEAEYEHHQPIGISRAWHPNGQLSREVIFSPESKQPIVREWNVNGELIVK